MRPNKPAAWLKAAGVFRGLGEVELRRLLSRCYTQSVERHGVLTEAGALCNALHIIVTGRFIGTAADGSVTGEYGPGHVFNESNFFTRSPCRETVTAVRESMVLTLEWEEFTELANRAPEYWQAVTLAFAVKAALAEPQRPLITYQKPHTLAIVAAGPSPLPPDIVRDIGGGFDPLADCQLLTSQSFGQNMPGGITLDDPEVMHWLKQEQQKFDLIIRVADSEWTPWTEMSVLEADEILLIGMCSRATSGKAIELNALEKQIFELRGVHSCRLALIHPGKPSPARMRLGTACWLANRPVRSHHAISQEMPDDYSRLARFVLGKSVGYIACGGGAAAVAHFGVIKALNEAGVDIDCVAGTGAGAVVAALIADGLAPEEAAGVFPLPRSRSDFERVTAAIFRGAAICDLALPFRALSADMTHGEGRVHVEGTVAEALVANWPPLGVAMPYLSAHGEHLADGSLIDPMPAWLLNDVHGGPNIIAKIAPPLRSEAAGGRDVSAFNWALKRFAGGQSLPADGGIGMADMMLRGLGLRKNAAVTRPGDVMLAPPPVAPDQADDQEAIMETAYLWTVGELQRLMDDDSQEAAPSFLQQ